MISIIVSYRDADYLDQLSKNIKETIGTEYEIIPIENNNAKYSICEAYNIGGSKSRFPYLCFVHEDVVFHTIDWGKVLVKLLAQQDIGLVGVAGASYKAAIASAWWDTEPPYHRAHIKQHYKGEVLMENKNPNQLDFDEVKSVDGVFLATRKEIWKEFSFDQKNFKGFHLYDADFSAAVSTKYKLLVTYQILIEHFSPGNSFSSDWLRSALIFQQKWKNNLPAFVGKLQLREKLAAERTASYSLIHRGHELRYPKRHLFKQMLINARFPYNIFFMVYYTYMRIKMYLKLVEMNPPD